MDELAPTAASGCRPRAPLKEYSANVDKPGPPGKTVEETYQKKTPLEHVLLRPDSYVGSTQKQSQVLWVYEDGGMVLREVAFVPGLQKIFDEILVNAADNKQRDPTMDTIRVDINPEANKIKVWNNGNGVPVVMHNEENCYVPEMIFGQLLTSSNYDDDEQKTTGGRNGYGAKLANIFSTEFTIETADGAHGLRYKQVFSKNMTEKEEPQITKCKASENWTCVTFTPDLKKFKVSLLEPDIVALMSKRVLDVAGCLGKGVKVELNGSRLQIKSFSDYVNLYLNAAGGIEPESQSLPRVYERVNERWEVVVSVTEGQFQQVSFVNSIATLRGGTHVNAITDHVVKSLVEKVQKKAGKAHAAGIKPHHVKSHLWVFVNAVIVNPAFDSQTKETLTTRAADFGSSCKVSDAFLTKVAKCGIVEKVLSLVTVKEGKELKKTDGSKRQRLTGIPKLDDANEAGGRNSEHCTLILTEGDSAKALAVSGLSVVGRDRYGVFPLRGKLLNVRDAAAQQIANNAEISSIKQIMGLKQGEDYSSTRSLRYGHLMIMTDQDHDGSHIKGLLVNFLHTFWPSLLKTPSFLLEFITPIVKATDSRGRTHSFYTIPEYESWKESLGGSTKGWSIKYYKGLGTSTPKEAKEYFAALSHHKKDFVWSGDQDNSSIELAFSKKKIEARKQWLREFEPGTFLDMSEDSINYSDFVNKELILFSVADNMRSIPCIMDGLKPGQRKILFSCFKRKLKCDVKVAQLAGYVSEHSAYHHGETSLAGTIIGLAQDFVGSNNLNLLVPSGQFGTRLQGGKDHASARYVYTRLHPVTRVVFPEADDCLLEYLNDDGQSIEPLWYTPILPMVLVNGSEGIGTGWSSSIPTYSPRDIVANLKRVMNGVPQLPMVPWYRGFKGTIEEVPSKTSGKTYLITGVVSQASDTVLEVTELPIRKWTQDYKETVEEWMTSSEKGREPFIKDAKEHHTDTAVHFELHLTEENMAAAMAEGLVKRLKLTTTVSTGNMHLFDKDGRMTKYDSPEQIVAAFFDVRLEFYERRRLAQLEQLGQELLRVENRVRFILAVVRGEIVISNRKKADLLAELQAKQFAPLASAKGGKASGKAVPGPPTDPNGSDEDENGSAHQSGGGGGGGGGGGFDYLLGMPLWSLTLEKVEQLCRERDVKRAEQEALLGTSARQLWDLDLDSFMEALELEEKRAAEESVNDAKVRRKAQNGDRKAPGNGNPRKGDFSRDKDSEENNQRASAPKPKQPAPAAPKARGRPKLANADALRQQPGGSDARRPDDGDALPQAAAQPTKKTGLAQGKAPKAAAVRRKKVVLSDSDDSDGADEESSAPDPKAPRARGKQGAPGNQADAPRPARRPTATAAEGAATLAGAFAQGVKISDGEEEGQRPAGPSTTSHGGARDNGDAQPAPRRTVRQQKPVTYQLSDSEDEGEDDDSFDEDEE